MDILISNLLSESILDFGKWSNGKYTNTHIYMSLIQHHGFCKYHESMSIPWIRASHLVFHYKYIIHLEKIQCIFKTNTISSNKKYNVQLGQKQYLINTNTNKSDLLVVLSWHSLNYGRGIL